MATGGDHERVRVTVLTGEANWASWKVQMRHQLWSRKLWKLVKGEEQLADGAEQGEKAAFEERCIYATIRLRYANISCSGFACAKSGLSCEDLGPIGEAVREEDSCIEAISSAKVFWGQDGRR